MLICQDTFNEEMYNLDNDSFLNSLEATMMATQPQPPPPPASGTWTTSRDSDV